MNKSVEGTEVIGMVAQWLKDNGCDGLVNVDAECGCGIDDLAPCGEISGNCTCGYKGLSEDGDVFFYVSRQEAEDSLQPSIPIGSIDRVRWELENLGA